MLLELLNSRRATQHGVSLNECAPVVGTQLLHLYRQGQVNAVTLGFLLQIQLVFR